jgi:hypothetical protein
MVFGAAYADARITSASVQTLSNGKPVLVVPTNIGLGSFGSKGSEVIVTVADVSSTCCPKKVLMPAMKTSANAQFFYSSAVLTGDGQALVLQNDGTSGGSSGSYPYDQVSVLNLSGKITKAVMKPGAAPTFQGTRWGDYSSAVPDPAAGNAVWTLGSYLASGRQQNWWFDITR